MAFAWYNTGVEEEKAMPPAGMGCGYAACALAVRLTTPQEDSKLTSVKLVHALAHMNERRMLKA